MVVAVPQQCDSRAQQAMLRMQKRSDAACLKLAGPDTADSCRVDHICTVPPTHCCDLPPRFMRFMSFLPKNGNQDALWDLNDGCQMSNAQFQGAQLYNRVTGTWQSWSWSRIE